MADIQIDAWENLYGSRWAGEIDPEAVAHPAKFNRKLIARIYSHARDEGWLPPGSQVVDCFAGVALGALDAMRLGMHWTGVELEPRFVRLGNLNIDLWNYRYAGKLPGWGTARIIRGDSRQMVALLAKPCNGEATALAVASPPFGKSVKGSGIAAAMRGEGNYNLTMAKPSNAYTPEAQGVAAGNLSAMPTGDIDLALASPPFLQVSGGSGVKPGVAPGSMLADPRLLARHSAGNPTAKGYGHDPASLTNKRVGSLDAAIASPPFLEGRESKRQPSSVAADLEIGGATEHRKVAYGETAGQMAAAAPDTFWSAARDIVAQTYASLRPGGHSIWVCKNYVKGGKIVPFTDQWRRLCESAGFVCLHEHRAMVVEDNGTQKGMDGHADKRHYKEHKSTFRQMVEKKGAPRIDFESVLCFERAE